MPVNPGRFEPSALVLAERAAGELRRGQPVIVGGSDRDAALICAVETTDAGMLAAFRARAGDGKVQIVLTPERAATLKIRQYVEGSAHIAAPPNLSIDGIRVIADPADDLDAPMKGPFSAIRDPGGLSPGGIAGIALAKRAGLLPAILLAPAPEGCGNLVRITPGDALAAAAEEVTTLTRIVQARVPIDGAEKARLTGFRAPGGGPDHYALTVGQIRSDTAVLTRVHSECFTGDLLGSLKCDCGPQLRGALARIVREGSGVLLYLAQEGRGIGLMNKLRAYHLQDRGFDTVEANQRLGFEVDERRFGLAAEMLRQLGIGQVRLLTNNPDKISQLETEGIGIAGRVPLVYSPNAHNAEYLKAKADKAGHML